jgi:2'-5' RNA ligase
LTKRRFFAALEIDDAARAACERVAARLRETGFIARYEDPRKFHVTLAFLGNVEPSRAGEIANALSQAAERAVAFDLMLDKLGAFPHERAPRIAYVGARARGAAFRSLATAVRAEYERLGFEFKDDAVAHVTVARVRQPSRPLPVLDVEPIRLHASALALFESFPDTERRTSRYEVVSSAPMLPPAP